MAVIFILILKFNAEDPDRSAVCQKIIKTPRTMEEISRKPIVWLARLGPCDITLSLFIKTMLQKGI